jgi:hypothetical protein
MNMYVYCIGSTPRIPRTMIKWTHAKHKSMHGAHLMHNAHSPYEIGIPGPLSLSCSSTKENQSAIQNRIGRLCNSCFQGRLVHPHTFAGLYD